MARGKCGIEPLQLVSLSTEIGDFVKTMGGPISEDTRTKQSPGERYGEDHPCAGRG